MLCWWVKKAVGLQVLGKPNSTHFLWWSVIVLRTEFECFWLVSLGRKGKISRIDIASLVLCSCNCPQLTVSERVVGLFYLKNVSSLILYCNLQGRIYSMLGEILGLAFVVYFLFCYIGVGGENRLAFWKLVSLYETTNKHKPNLITQMGPEMMVTIFWKKNSVFVCLTNILTSIYIKIK